MAATKVLGCIQFSTKDSYTDCRSLQAHFLGGTLTILVGGVVVVTLLVFTVALMVRHRVCSNHDDHHDIGDEAGCSGSDSMPLPAKGTHVFSQSNGNGDVMMVVLPNGLLQKQRGGAGAAGSSPKPPPTPKPKMLPKPKVNLEQLRAGIEGGVGIQRALPPYTPETERMPMYYSPKNSSPSTLPRQSRQLAAGQGKLQAANKASFSLAPPPHYDTDLSDRRFSTGGALVVRQGVTDSTWNSSLAYQSPIHGAVRRKRSSSFDMGNMATTTCYSYARRLSVIWTKRSQSLHGMLVQCASTTSASTTTSSSSGDSQLRHKRGYIHAYNTTNSNSNPSTTNADRKKDKEKEKEKEKEKGEELEESVV